MVRKNKGGRTAQVDFKPNGYKTKLNQSIQQQMMVVQGLKEKKN